MTQPGGARRPGAQQHLRPGQCCRAGLREVPAIVRGFERAAQAPGASAREPEAG
jgi:hypothetical protein